MTCYLVTEFEGKEIPEVIEIFKTREEATNFLKSYNGGKAEIELGDDKWLELI